MDIRTEIVSPANEQYKIALRAFKRPEGGPEVGAATPVYAENAVCAPCVNHFLSAVSALCVNADSLRNLSNW